MRLIKNTALNAAELYKLLGNNNTVYYKRLGMVQVNKLELLENPASNVVVVYTHDGSDYSIFINDIVEVFDFDLNQNNMKYVIVTAILSSALTYAIVKFSNQVDKVENTGNIPEFYWNDRVVPPHRGFELKVDMYYNETKDTIYMEYSAGPEGE